MSQREKTVLVGLHRPTVKRYMVEDSLEELAQLVATAGGQECGRIIQERDKPTPAYYIGKGKAQELAAWCKSRHIEMVVFDEELSPSQQHNLEKVIQCKVLDRTGLILDVFARHARSREGQLQVELAQLKYMLPRLMGKGVELSRLGAGIGTRGPGETKLETDRRRIKRRINHIQYKLGQVRRQRQLYRCKRQSVPMPVVALVGYTNAGKSTLMNALTDAGVLVQDKLFATLDPTTRRLQLPNHQTVLLSDTVGFIRKLPHQLIEAFKATLEEVAEADLLLHVIDASHFEMNEQAQTVREILRELGLEEKPCIPVLNKIDRFKHRNTVNCLFARIPGACAVSALKRTGLEELLNRIAAELRRLSCGRRTDLALSLPYEQSDLLALLHQKGQVLKIEYLPDRMLVEARTDSHTAGIIRQQLQHSDGMREQIGLPGR